MFNPDKNKIYKISYYINNVEYFSFSKLAGKNIFRDVITGKLYKFQDVANVIYTEVDPNLIKYFSKLYKKQKNINVFLSTNYTDENLFLYINILRFFDLKPKDFIKNNKNINIKNKIINKCKGYLKRYFNIDELENYISNLNKLDDICSILSYKPYEFMVNKYYNKLFWVDKFLSCNHFKNELFELKKEIFIISDILNLNVNEYVLNKNKYILKIKENRNILLKKLEDEYKNQLKIALRDKIEKSKNTLLEEKKYAETVGDDDLLFEIQTISDLILNTENETLIKIQNLNIKTNINDFWPDILYPIPDSVCEIYDINNDKLKTIDNFLSEHGH